MEQIIIEGLTGNSRRNLINYFSISLRSANETRYWLRLIRDTLGNKEEELDYFIEEAEESAKILAKSILTMKKNDLFAEAKGKSES